MSEKIKFEKQIKEKILQIVFICIVTTLIYFIVGFFVEEQGKRTTLTIIVAASYLVCRKQQRGEVITTCAPAFNKSKFYIFGVLLGFFVICYIALGVMSLLK